MTEKLAMSPARSGRRITLSLTPPALIGGMLGLCAGFVLVFSLGVLLGRGHNLEERIPRLEQLLPEKAAPQPPVVIAEGENRDQQSTAANGRNATREEPPMPSGIIGQGDLEYRDNLKQPTQPQRPAPPPPTRTTPEKPAAKPEQVKPQTQKPAAQAAGQTPPRAADRTPASGSPGLQPLGPNMTPVASGPERTAPVNAAQSDGQRFQYVYQAAAYKDEPSCSAFAAKLKKAGFQARVQKSDSDGTVWYRTMVDFTGTPDATDVLRENLKKHGVPRVLLKSKTPVK